MMVTKKSRTWALAEAAEVAEDLIRLLGPDCDRIEIAGSVRRCKPNVGDIELLVIPKTAPTDTLWLDRTPLDKRILEFMVDGILDYRLNKKGIRTYGRLNKLLIHVPSGIGVDLFSTTAENWGMSLVVRTGPAEFCVKMMSRFRALGLKGHAYGGVEDPLGTQLPCPTEEEVFRLARCSYIPPEKRF